MGKRTTGARRETPKAHEAFEYYFLLGSNRSLKKVVEHFGYSMSLVEQWSTAFNWVNRCEERDRRNMELIAEADDRAYVEGMRNYKKMIAASIAEYVKALKDGNVAVNTVKDFDKLVRLDMDLNDRIIENNDAKLNNNSTDAEMTVLEAMLADIRKDMADAAADASDLTDAGFARVDDVLDNDDEEA